MPGETYVATNDERDTMLAGLLRMRVRELRQARDVEQVAARYCNARVRKAEAELRAALSNAAMCGIKIEPEASEVGDPLFAECTTSDGHQFTTAAYARDPEPFTEAEIARMTGLEA